MGRTAIFSTLAPALLGAAAGYGYATVAGEEQAIIRALYGAMGGVAGVMTLRLAILFRAMFRDFFGR